MTPLYGSEADVLKDIIKHIENENETAGEYIKYLKTVLDEHDIDYE